GLCWSPSFADKCPNQTAPSGIPNPTDAGCNSDSARDSNTPILQYSNTPILQYSNTPILQYSNTPILHHSARPDSRTRTTTRTRTKQPIVSRRPYSVDSSEEPAFVCGLRVVCPSFARGSRCANVTCQ